MKKGILCGWLCCAFVFVFGQETSDKTYFIKKSDSEIKVDGVLEEAAWSTAQVVEDFVQNFPTDTLPASSRTEVRVTYDDRFLYVAAVCHDTASEKFVIQSLKRDFSYPKTDAFAVFLDPIGDQNNGFSFAVNPYGVQREGLVANGGTFGVTTSWDQKWYSEVKQLEDRWVVEMAIPFKSIRYKEGVDKWRINFSRHDLKINENAAWSRVPRNFNIAGLAFTGELIWDEPPKKAGGNVALIPYLIGGISNDYEAKSGTEYKYNFGGDAKMAITSSLYLDVTINPDFSQVEVDAQITDLDRFSLFFPEKRQFFIENSDLFGQFGFRRIRPFFSRRIGLSGGSEIPILAGARLSGKVNQDWRIGVMSIQTQGDGELGVQSQNYSVGAVQWQLFGRSNISGIVVNRQAFNDFNWDKGDFNTIAGLDFNLASKNDRLKGKAFYHQSFDGSGKGDAAANATFFLYNSQRVFAMWNHEYVGENYRADVGFVPRKGYWRLEPEFNYRFYPENSRLNNHVASVYADVYLDKSFEPTDWVYRLRHELNFLNKSELNFTYFERFTALTDSFDASGTGGLALPPGKYCYRNGNIFYLSDFRRKFSFSQALEYGSYFNGTRWRIKSSVNYRAQPWGVFTLVYERNQINLPDPYSNGTITLIGPKIELSFTRSLFFTTFIQYNTQIDNLNVNSRLQWRFKPLSDLYFVYTDNYLPGVPGDDILDYRVKNRAVVLKFVYWFSL